MLKVICFVRALEAVAVSCAHLSGSDRKWCFTSWFEGLEEALKEVVFWDGASAE